MAIVALEGVVKDYPLGKTTVHALRGIDLTFERGEFTVIAGPSGSGKTTVLNLVGCVDVPTAGVVRIDGLNVRKLNDRQRTRLRLDKLGFIFQSFNLVPVLDVRQNVEFPLLLQKDVKKAERQRRVMEVVERVGLTDQLKQRPGELSGGQRQRVAIARALVTGPAIVLADEPTANLDSATGQTILDLMHELNREQKTTFIFSTHDPQVMSQAERIVLLSDGLVVEDRRTTPTAGASELATA